MLRSRQGPLTDLRRLLESRYASHRLRGRGAVGARRHFLGWTRKRSRFRRAVGALVVPAPCRGHRGGCRHRLGSGSECHPNHLTLANRGSPGRQRVGRAGQNDRWVVQLDRHLGDRGSSKPFVSDGGRRLLSYARRSSPARQRQRGAVRRPDERTVATRPLRKQRSTGAGCLRSWRSSSAGISWPTWSSTTRGWGCARSP